jgi:hypothetical protein
MTSLESKKNNTHCVSATPCMYVSAELQSPIIHASFSQSLVETSNAYALSWNACLPYDNENLCEPISLYIYIYIVYLYYTYVEHRCRFSTCPTRHQHSVGFVWSRRTQTNPLWFGCQKRKLSRIPEILDHTVASVEKTETCTHSTPIPRHSRFRHHHAT